MVSIEFTMKKIIKTGELRMLNDEIEEPLASYYKNDEGGIGGSGMNYC